jgi:hypothetical protein
MLSRVRAAAVAVAAAASVVGLGVTAPAADAGSGIQHIKVNMTNTAMYFSSGPTIHAGRTVFTVVDKHADDTLQLVRLSRGYPLRQFGRDIGAAFNGNLKAIHRVDTLVTWFGGAEANPSHNGVFSETLYAGTYYAIAENHNVRKKITVVGTPSAASWIANNSTITTTAKNKYYTGGHTTLPRTGWTLFRNHSSEPHMLVLQKVKSSTTGSMVRNFIKHPSGTPSWALHLSTSTGIISPGTQMLWHHNLPSGRYLLMCFWPDDETGMPHFFMGMWKLVNFK